MWRVDVEISRDPLTGKRRRTSRRIHGTRKDAEVALAKLRVADHERRAHRPGTRARTVRAALDAYLADVDAGIIELAPKTVVTTRSACNTMCSIVLGDGKGFGDIRLSSLGWQDIKEMFRVMRADRSAAWVRRVGTVLSRGLEAARLLGISRSLAYELVNEWIDTGGRAGLPAIRFGRRLLVKRSVLEQWASDPGAA